MARQPTRTRTAPSRFPGYALLLLVAAAGAVGWALSASTQAPKAEACPAGAECVTIRTTTGDHLFTAEWAVTAAERSCGLMFREEMAADHGMVFDFRVERGVSFWMSNTLISLDMIFIKASGEVLNVAEFTTPLSLEGVPSAGPVRYVLEVVGGTADRIGLAAGDMIDLERAPGMTAGTAVCFPPPE
ncbi:MAG: DUF192 domain-containing protein [Alphaproteobacteria bacterium]